MTASVRSTMEAINHALGSSEYRCQTVSWDDVERGTVGGSLSSLGANITDTRLWERHGQQLYTVRSQNWNEKLGAVSSHDIALMAGGVEEGSPPQPVTLASFLASIGQHGAYCGMKSATNLSNEVMDAKVSIRFQTTFLPVPDEQFGALEFAPEMYNYQTRSDDDPKNLLLLCTTQGSAIQQDGAGAKKLYHHAVNPSDKTGEVCRYWFEAERTKHKVGGAQKETDEEKADALKRGKAVSAVIGTRAMGTRFNVLMTIQIPLEQTKLPTCRGGGLLNTNFLKKVVKSKGSMMGGMMGGMMESGGAKKEQEFDLESDFDEDWALEVEAGMEGEGSCDLLCDFLDTPVECAAAGMSPMDYAANDEEAELMMLEQMMVGAPAPPLMAMPACNARKGRRAARSPPPRKGAASAARVSRGSLHDKWGGLSKKAPVRDGTQHVTVTVVIYNTVAGGVPSVEDVKTAVADMEELYAACGWTGKLASDAAGFMKSELTVDSVATIAAKVATQPYVPENAAPVGGDVFPTSVGA